VGREQRVPGRRRRGELVRKPGAGRDAPLGHQTLRDREEVQRERGAELGGVADEVGVGEPLRALRRRVKRVAEQQRLLGVARQRVRVAVRRRRSATAYVALGTRDAVGDRGPQLRLARRPGAVSLGCGELAQQRVDEGVVVQRGALPVGLLEHDRVTVLVVAAGRTVADVGDQRASPGGQRDAQRPGLEDVDPGFAHERVEQPLPGGAPRDVGRAH
jgi:hypothetical protein